MNTFSSKEVLRQAGFRATPGRIAFLEILYSAAKPLSVQDILKALKRDTIDQATAYRIVEALRSKGVIHYVNMEHGHVHFELATSKHHHHAICESCGEIVDISECDIPRLEKEVLKSTGFKQLKHHALEFFGICQKCSKKLIQKKSPRK